MSMASKTVSSRLPDIVGHAHVISDPALLGAYEIAGKKPTAAVLPATSEEAAELVKFAAAEKLPLVPTGARTKLGMGHPPAQYEIALDMTRLDKIVAYDPGDLTLSVETGVPVGRLGDELAKHRQFLPLAVPYMKQATVGGTISTGVDSPLRQFYGTARDFVLGMEFVTGEGVLAKSGGRVVKNVTGYDLHKLMIGSLGTLGVITKINFRTFPMPAASRGFVAAFESASQALQMRHRIAQSPLTPLTLEILSPRVGEIFASEAATRTEPTALPANLVLKTHWTLTTGYAGHEKVLERYAKELRRMAGETGALGVTVLGDDLRPAVWGRMREFIPIAMDYSPAATIMKLSVLPTQLEEALAGAEGIAERHELPWAAMARGLGIIYFVVLPGERSAESLRRVKETTGDIRSLVSDLTGNSSIPWCPAEWRQAIAFSRRSAADDAQMEKLKRIFDVHNILSPGRLWGGF